MISSKKTYFGIAGGMLFLFLMSSITFIIIGINKDESLFENVAITLSLVMSLLLFLVGFSVSLYLALKKRQISEK